MAGILSLEQLVINKKMKVWKMSPFSFLPFLICLLIVGLATMLMPYVLARLLLPRSPGRSSVWLLRAQDGFTALPVVEGRVERLYPAHDDSFEPSQSPFMLAPGSDISGTVYTKKKPDQSTPVYTVGYYDPEQELHFLGRTNFTECEYNKCRMTHVPESADAVIFYVVKLKNSPVPKFRRKSGQIWVFYTNEAPSRFSWFINLNRTGIRDQMNWTMTHKLDSDIPIFYGRLMEDDRHTEKDFDKIYDSKTKTAAWFVSHCPVRSDRSIYVSKMQKRIDVDGYGVCGTLTCGQGEKIPGVVEMRNEADKETCFPLLSSTYKFYLAFENSLCQEYVTEKFFKLFNNVDVVPVVRGGADYKRYFPPGTYVDAADFNSPEALADFLDDLGNDKSRYIDYLRRKNRYRVVWDFPEWHCKLCQKLHVDRQKRTYKNIHEWFTKDSCVDPKDFR